ncbi:MAG: response regulator transcription factor [Eubacteriales bacterium]|nr:response regulator transcription factor [Eubacteriales bacterium]
MARLLLVEDDPMILNALTAFLREEGFETETADGQRAALELLSRHSFDLVLLDITLREGNGFDTCQAIKAQSAVPVFFLTASGDESSTVAGLDMGADDYIAKPFRPRELLSRIRSALRRSGADAARLMLGPLMLDTDKGEVYREGVPLALSALEYRMLLLFAGNRGKLLSRNRLLEELWDMGGEFVNDNTLTVCIKRLRDKIEEDPAAPRIIKTVRGLGYRAD